MTRLSIGVKVERGCWWGFTILWDRSRARAPKAVPPNALADLSSNVTAESPLGGIFAASDIVQCRFTDFFGFQS